jgi:hypothetical protein
MVRSGYIACDQINAGGLHMTITLATPLVSLLAGMGRAQLLAGSSVARPSAALAAASYVFCLVALLFLPETRGTP